MRVLKRLPAAIAALILSTTSVNAQQPDWSAVDAETLQHFQAMVRMDTSDPPGREIELTEYLVSVLQQEGIEVDVYSLDPVRPNVVARLRGNGSKRPILMMAHQDTVNVDPDKWVFPPFSAERDGGYIYGRGTVDDKDNVVASLMTLLLLKRSGAQLDRDVIFLAESGEEGATQIGIQFMTEQHFDAIDAEHCIAEGGSVVRQGGQVHYAAVQTVEKLPRAVTLTSTGVAGHGSVPLESNALVHMSKAISAAADWQPPVRLSDTTTSFFSRMASVSSPEAAERYRAMLNPGSAQGQAALAYLKANEPRNAAVLFSTISPTIVNGGYRTNVIPSEVTATLDVRLLPDEDPEQFIAALREVIGDEAIEANWASRNVRPGASTPLDTDAFRTIEQVMQEHYNATVIPTMSTGATDMAYLRAKGINCYGIGPAIDAEDGPLGFGAHSDQERIIEAELYRFVRVHYEIVERLAAAQ
ncbi:MAG: M20/M25/M40 family metallo-hydrolase [Pseudohongiella sp.]|nr:M20/M25/M40 family metallo-hydrolase [Pseudohongiella sp.]